SGWVSLFNGKDLAGWTGDVGLMTVENGVLAVDDGKSGTVIAPGDYQDVEVEIEFRLENRGNSGLGICYSGEGRSSQNGLEIQMLDDDGYPGVKNVQKCGSVFSLAPAKPGHFKRWPAWNSMRVTSTDSIVRVELNGVPVTDTTRQLMQQVNPQHGGIMRTSGKLCLLPNTGRSEYRNFRVRKTSDSALASASADRPERGRTTTPASASPGDALQGNWVAVGVEEANGRPLPGITEKRYVFNDRKLIMTRKSNGVPGKYEGTFTVDAAAGHFDFSGVGPAGKPVAWRGIYKRDGDSLTLCYKYVKDDSTIRPTEFRTDDKEKTPFVLVKLQRDPQASPRQGPPQDASRFKGHAYKFFPEVLTWHEAKSRCEEIGGHLAIISSAAENNFVAELAKQGIPQWGNKDGVWLGATDEKQEGDWRWIDEQSLGFKAWGRGQPNNKDNNEHYLMLYLAEGNWSDQPAKSVQHTVYFVCEWETAR
ncbi:MAG TPA: family 16 glycoside hydrolase, partial [Planctomycetaceae bacterium]